MKTKDKAGSKAARAMAKLRWAKVPKAERHRLMTQWGKLGGRPKSTLRCFCGAHTMERAQSRSFDCCRAAGLMTLDMAQDLRRRAEQKGKAQERVKLNGANLKLKERLKKR